MNRWQELAERISKAKDGATCGISLRIITGNEAPVALVVSFMGDYTPQPHGLGHFDSPAVVAGPFDTEDEAYEHLRGVVEKLDGVRSDG